MPGWVTLGQALEHTGDTAEADAAYAKAIELAGFGDVAEVAERGRSRIASAIFRENGVDGERMDAVMYCLAALERFAEMPEADVQQVVSEIALLGQRGLNVNDPEKAYRLRSLPGSFSGLQLVSYLYVGLRQVAPVNRRPKIPVHRRLTVPPFRGADEGLRKRIRWTV